jgi:hypothetical protein
VTERAMRAENWLVGEMIKITNFTNSTNEMQLKDAMSVTSD